MFETLSLLPLPFWIVVCLLLLGAVRAYRSIKSGIGIPMLAVLGTVAVWYLGDVMYNEYGEYLVMFDEATISSAWWQVADFVAVFLILTHRLHLTWNLKYMSRGSGILTLFESGVDLPSFQARLRSLFVSCLCIWLILIIIAAFRLKVDLPYYLFPFLGYRAEPWGRQRIGSGFDALLSLAVYLQLMVTAMFGMVAALLTDKRLRPVAIICCILTWPYFVFDRTRNTMLAAVVPGVLSWVLLRLRGSLWKKVGVLAVCFLVVNAWMAFVIANRSKNSIMAAFKEQGFKVGQSQKIRHEGLNMFEELCWVTHFIEQGSYSANWGSRYFAELVNPIPRVLWQGKPMIGIDYAILRGQAGGEDGQAGVNATISTGLIGQGVVNFGRLLGPASAALLMSIWASVLARLELRIHEIGRMPLYGLGMILTFNLGRDITFITLYPFVFGTLFMWLAEQLNAAPACIEQMRYPASENRNGATVPTQARAHFERPLLVISGRSGGSLFRRRRAARW